MENKMDIPQHSHYILSGIWSKIVDFLIHLTVFSKKDT